jgi:DNA repair protein RadA/Sms
MDDENEGSVVTAVYEGTRPLLLEIQALTSKTAVGFPRRTALGIGNGRLSMIIAVLERRTGISLADQDVYVNIVGGLKPEGTSTDLAVALALYSTFTGINIRKDTLALGEVGLTGDLRPVRNVEKIIKEAGRMGMRKVILPGSQAVKLLREQKDLCKGDSAGSFIEISGAKNLREAIAACSE